MAIASLPGSKDGIFKQVLITSMKEYTDTTTLTNMLVSCNSAAKVAQTEHKSNHLSGESSTPPWLPLLRWETESTVPPLQMSSRSNQTTERARCKTNMLTQFTGASPSRGPVHPSLLES